MLLDNLLDETSILERIDDYSIYSYYIGHELDLGKAYTSPIRSDDDVPSFSLFEYSNKIFFKDHAIGESGTVFKFVQLLYSYKKRTDAYSKINIDFELGLQGGKEIPKNEVKGTKTNGYKKNTFKKILIKSREIVTQEFTDFWLQYGITAKTNKLYNTTNPETVVMVYEKKKLPFYPKKLTIAYRIDKYYQIYSPTEQKQFKFRNNYPPDIVLGYDQLTYELDFLIITKANKEIQFFREHFDWDSISGKSETTIIGRKTMLILLQKYKTVFIWLDNDIPGQKAQAKWLEEYPFLIPIFHNVKEKDVTDYYAKAVDKQKVLTEIKNLIYERH